GPLFFPWHVIKDTVMMAAVFASLFTLTVLVPAHLDEIANPADASYIPRPEWYFLALFQMLKYFPGPLEPVATMVIPGAVIGFLLLLPFLDRGKVRHPLQRSRRWFTVAFAGLGAGVIGLTALGLADRPLHRDPNDWGLLSIEGMRLATGKGATCARCHAAGGPASALARIRLTKDDEWLLAHMADPIAIAPGVRPADQPSPRRVMTRMQAVAVVAFLRRQYGGATLPVIPHDVAAAAQTYAEVCVACHRMSGEGGSVGPDLTHVGRRRDEETLRMLIADPLTAYPDSEMPPFKETLTPEQIATLARYLSSRR
ncbi:MAG TPA: c-type cytochrome, partial [Vicinamibacterales bacterium]